MNHPTAETVFLVSGGARGITAQCVIALARRYHARFILVGRSAYSETDPPWAEGVQDEAALTRAAMTHLRAQGTPPTPRRLRHLVRSVRARREIAATLRAVAQAGGQALYARADVTDADALRRAVQAAERRLGRVTAILHGAGVLADKPIARKPVEDFERVVAVKVQGLANLLACVPPERLTWLILFSSVAAFYGNVGQADYAAANEVLNKVAHWFAARHPTCRVLAMDWGPWDGGMVTPALRRVLADRGIPLIPADAGSRFLADEVAREEGAVQLVIGGAMLPSPFAPDDTLRRHHIRRTLTLEANPFLRDHVIGGKAVLPTVCAVAWGIGAGEGLYPGYTFTRVEDYRVFKGIVFDETLAPSYTLELEELAKGDDAITYTALIRSEADGKARPHYRMQVTLQRTLPPAPTFDDFDLTERDPIAGAELYADGTLFHGPSFRGVERVLNLNAQGLTMRCRCPALPPEQQGQFPVGSFNPYATDAQLQSLLIWARRRQGVVGLPLRIRGGVQYRPAPSGEAVYVTMRVRETDAYHLVADVFTHDEAGRLYSHVTGAEITLSKRLNALFARRTLDAPTKGDALGTQD